MNTPPIPLGTDNSVYIERLQQAIRVMEGLSDEQRFKNVDIGVFVRNSDNGIVGCIGGLCGMDPWFQQEGLTSILNDGGGTVSIQLSVFFGTAEPFYRSNYNVPGRVTVEDAISALDRAIERFKAIALEPLPLFTES